MKIMFIVAVILTISVNISPVEKEWIKSRFELMFEIPNERLTEIAEKNNMAFEVDYIEADIYSSDEALEKNWNLDYFMYECIGIYEHQSDIYLVVSFINKKKNMVFIADKNGKLLDKVELIDEDKFSVFNLRTIANKAIIGSYRKDIVIEKLDMKIIDETDQYTKNLIEYFPFYENKNYINITSSKNFVNSLNDISGELKIFDIQRQVVTTEITMDMYKSEPQNGYLLDEDYSPFFIHKNGGSIFLYANNPSFFCYYETGTYSVNYIEIEQIRDVFNTGRSRIVQMGWFSYEISLGSETFYVIIESINGVYVLKYINELKQ